MGETEALQEALARSDRGKARLESENAQLRRELKKVRSTLDELLERFQTAVRTAQDNLIFISSDPCVPCEALSGAFRDCRWPVAD